VRRIGDHVEAFGGKGGAVLGADLLGTQPPFGQALHQPGYDTAHRDRVESVHVCAAVQPLGCPLVENPGQRPQRLIRLVVLLVLVPQLLADRRAGLAAHRLLLGLNRLFVELLQIVVDDELIVHLQPLLFGRVHAAIVEEHQPPAEGRIVHA